MPRNLLIITKRDCGCHLRSGAVWKRSNLSSCEPFPSHNLLWLVAVLTRTTSTSLECRGRNVNMAGRRSVWCEADAFRSLWELASSLPVHPHPSTKPLSIVGSIGMYSIRKESVPCKLLFCSWLQWFVEAREVELSEEIRSCNQIKSQLALPCSDRYYSTTGHTLC